MSVPNQNITPAAPNLLDQSGWSLLRVDVSLISRDPMKFRLVGWYRNGAGRVERRVLEGPDHRSMARDLAETPPTV